jgi:hypothetical protein
MRGVWRQPGGGWGARIPRITDRLQTTARLCCIGS